MFAATRFGCLTSKIPASPDFSSVVCLLHMEGASIVDTKGGVVSGTGALVTEKSKFGLSSMNGLTGNVLITSDNLIMGTGDFTLEGYFYPMDIGGVYGLFTYGDYTTTGMGFEVYGLGGELHVYGAGEQLTTVGSGYTQYAWNHIALTRASGVLNMFVNGVKNAVSGSYPYNLTSNKLYMIVTGGYTYNGYIDEFRATRGIARYTANFTVPTTAFPNL